MSSVFNVVLSIMKGQLEESTLESSGIDVSEEPILGRVHLHNTMDKVE